MGTNTLHLCNTFRISCCFYNTLVMSPPRFPLGQCNQNRPGPGSLVSYFIIVSILQIKRNKITCFYLALMFLKYGSSMLRWSLTGPRGGLCTAGLGTVPVVERQICLSRVENRTLSCQPQASVCGQGQNYSGPALLKDLSGKTKFLDRNKFTGS